MKTKTTLAMIAVVCFSLALITNGCVRRNRTGTKAETVKSTEGPGSADAANASSSPVTLTVDSKDEDGVDLAEKQEIRRKFQLRPESKVEVHGINGGVKVETADIDTAEVLVVRSAKTQEDLKQYRQVKIEQHENRLVIAIEGDRKSVFSSLGRIPEGRQRVVLKLPRKIDFEVSSTNGNVTVGEIQGRIGLYRVNGQIKMARVNGATELNGVNGGIDVSFAPLTGNGVEIRGVNGNIDLRFEGEVNAELDTWGVNGNVEPDLPGVAQKEEEPRRGRMRARIGSGGTRIEISGVNGNVKLMKAEKQGATTAKAGQ
jgi:DUF4097 and DUF4098 domain-containing protein YvlB